MDADQHLPDIQPVGQIEFHHHQRLLLFHQKCRQHVARQRGRFLSCGLVHGMNQ